MPNAKRIEFEGATGETLAARLDLPAGPVRAYALFAHCFTCSKDIFAARRIADTLTEHGIATLRFDFTGLGHSDGEFANTNFTSNVDDLIAAADHLRQEREAPALLIGHSLGGAAVLAAAARVPEAAAVVTIGAPADPAHVSHNFADEIAEIEAKGEAEVTLGGRPFTIRKSFLEDIAHQKLTEAIGSLRKALLVMHAPLDETVGVDNAGAIFTAAKHPKSFVSLDGADHLVSRKEDADYAATMIAAWATRFLPPSETTPERGEDGAVVVAENGLGKFSQDIVTGGHLIHADEPPSLGGSNTGPSPYQLLSAALGACTTMTMRLYADRKEWPLERSRVVIRHDKVHAEDCADCETRDGKIDEFVREIELVGDLDAEQRARILEIADKCPVHRTLHSETKVRTVLREA